MDKARFENTVALRDAGRIEDAIQEFHLMAAAVSDADDKAALMINEHECYCSLGRLKEAKAILADIRKVGFNNNVVRLIVDYGEACMAIQTGDLKGGLARLDQVLHEHPGSIQDSHFRYLYEGIQQRRAFALTNLGRHRDALPLLKEVSSFRNPTVYDQQQVHLYLGICYGELGQGNLAKEEFLRTIDFSLKNDIEAQARYRAGLLYFTDGAFAQAKQHLETILQIHSGNIPNLPRNYVYEQLSRTCHYLGEEQNAKRYMKMAKESSAVTT